MKSILLALSIILTVISNTVYNSTEVKENTISNNTYHIENSKYPYNKTLTSFDKSLEYRLYIDTTDDMLQPAENKIDFNWGYKEKNIWHDLELPIAIYHFEDFNVTSKNDLIATVGSTFTLDYYYAFNMWDSWKGWRYEGGKNNELKKTSDTVDLKTEAYTKEIQYEKASSGTEANRLQLRQEWNNNGLTIYLRMSVWYHWSWGSVVNHAALTKFSLTNVDNGGTGSANIQFANKTTPVTASHSLLPGTYSLSLSSLFDDARVVYNEKEKNDWKAAFPLFIAYGMTGPLVCEGIIGIAIINLLSPLPLFKDIAYVMLTGINHEGSLKVINSLSRGVMVSTLYYVSLDGTSSKISADTIPLGCTSATYAGLSTLTYMYLL